MLLQPLNEQLLMTFECVSAIGTSLHLGEMVEHFMRVFSCKTGAIASMYWMRKTKEETCFEELRFLGKQSFKALFERPICKKISSKIFIKQFDKQTLLYVMVHEDCMVFLFQTSQQEFAMLEAIISSFHAKLENAVRACKNHAELIEINKTLERRIEEEVEKNREKDKHILQQSRLAQMGEMISMIAHQWRQPLGSISAVAASLKLKITLNKLNYSTKEAEEESKAFLLDSMSKIESYVHFLTHTIDDFRNFCKPNKQKESVSLAHLVERTLEIIGKALEINGIQITVEKESDEEIFTYANEVTQVILNVLKNSEDVIKERAIKNPYITIRIHSTSEWEEVYIEDNAGGIAESVLPHIFEPYFSTKSEKNGTGLGLYMSKTIIEEHCNGLILASNTNEGARFTIRLKKGQS